MKRLFLIAALVALLASGAFAQTPIFPSRYTVATLPAASTLANKIVSVTDSLTQGDCTIGGGSLTSPCRSNGSSWVPWGDGTGAGSSPVTNVSGTSPISSSGGATPAISIDNAKADGSTKGAADFLAADFNDDGAGKISLDYTNGQKATASVPGFLSSADFSTFSAKQAAGNYLVDCGSNGWLARTALNTTACRTLTGTANRVSISNTTGGGDPVFNVPDSAQLNVAKLVNLTSNGVVHTSGGDGTLGASLIVNADVSASAAIVYSKLTLTGSILNADLAGSIAFSKLLGTDRTLTAGAGLTGGGDLSADRTFNVGAGAGITINADDVALTTPGTLTVSSTNSASGNHTHVITSSSNPGAAASLLASDASGYLRLIRLGLGTGTVPMSELEVIHANGLGAYFTTTADGNGIALGGNATVGLISTNQAVPMTFLINGTEKARLDASGNLGIGRTTVGYKLDVNGTMGVGGVATFASDVQLSAATANLFMKDTSTGFQVSSTTVINPQASNSIRSTSFTSGLLGWNISALGNAEFANVDVRGAIHASIFTYNGINITAGTQLVTPSGAKLKNDVVVTAAPTYGTTTFSIDAVDQDGVTHAASQLFAVNDIIRLKDGLVGDTWFKVTAVSDQTTFWRYTASIQAGSNNATYRAGQGIPDYGVSGKGGIILTADQANAPYMQMFTHLATFSSADANGTLNLTPQMRIGNLNGSYGYATDVYGAAFGPSTGAWIKVDPTNGVRIGFNSTTKTQIDAAGNASFDGTITARNGDILGDLNVGTGGQLRSGATAITTANGWWFDNNGGTPRARIGTVSAGALVNGLLWDGSNLQINAASYVFNAANLVIDSAGIIKSGASAITTGNGWYFDYNAGTPRFRVGTVSGGGLVNGILWDGSSLTVNGGGTFTGALSAATGTFAGSLSAATGTFAGSLSAATGTFAGSLSAASGTFAGSLTAASGAITGTLTMSGASSAIAIGTTPPTSSSVGTGIWLDRTGLYSLNASVRGLTLDSTGITLLPDISNYLSPAALKFKDAGGTEISRFYAVGDSGAVNPPTAWWIAQSDSATAVIALQAQSRTAGAAQPGSTSLALWYNPTNGAGSVRVTPANGMIVGASAAPNAMLDVRGDAIVTGLLKAGSGPTTLTDSAGKLLAAAHNTLTTAVGGTNKTSWTAGSVPYLTSTTAFAEDNANFFWDGTNHRLGVGTVSPGYMVTLSGSAATFGGAAVAMYDTAGQTNSRNWLIGNIAAVNYGDLTFAGSTAAGGAPTTARVTFDKSGNVRFHAYGVGTLTSDASGNITSVSDLSMKRDVRPFTRGLDSLIGLRPIMYGYTKESGLDQTKDNYVGYGAQNVRDFIPEAVGRDASGRLTLWDRPILDTAINSILELNARIKTLETEVLKLKENRRQP